MERIWLNLMLSARSQVQLQEKTMMMNNINAEGASVGVETRARAIINDDNNHNTRRRL